MVTLLHLCSSVGGEAGVYGRDESIQEVFKSLQTRYGVSAWQVKERLLGLKRNLRESVFDLAVEI